jgi:DNA-binding transcriptional LysR family regulator
MDRLKALEVFVAIAELGSFRRAALQLRLSPAMVTTHLNRLEEQLGVRLIARTTRRLDLTDRGHSFLKDARAILQMVTAAEKRVGSGDGRPTGHVRLDAPASLGTLYLVPALKRLREAYPDIVIDLTLGDRGTQFRADGFDILLRVGELPRADSVASPLGETRFVLVAAPAYLERRGAPGSLPELLDHDCILYSTVEVPGGSPWRFERDGEPHRISPNAVLTFNDGRAITDAAIAGNGLAQNLEMLVQEPLADGRLVRVLESWCNATAPVVLLCPTDRHELPAVRAVMDFLAEQVAWGLQQEGVGT